jgi:hypothetical protein
MLHNSMDGSFDQEASQQIGVNSLIGHSLIAVPSKA